MSKPEISWRYFGSNRPFSSIAVRFHRRLWINTKKNENFGKQKLKKMRWEWLYLGMGLGFWGEGLRGTKYLSMEMSLEQFFGFGILEKSKSKVKKATTRSFPANYFCRARNCGWAGPGCQYLVGLGRVKPDPTSVKLCFCF